MKMFQIKTSNFYSIEISVNNIGCQPGLTNFVQKMMPAEDQEKCFLLSFKIIKSTGGLKRTQDFLFSFLSSLPFSLLPLQGDRVSAQQDLCFSPLGFLRS